MDSVHYQIHSHCPDKPWIMLIHGLFGSLDNLSALRRQFTGAFQVLSVDLPDHGKSVFTESFGFVQYANRITELVHSLKIKQLCLVGHSLGEKVAMQIARTHHALICHLFVIDIAPVRYIARINNVLQGFNNVVLSDITSRQEADLDL